MSKNDYVQADFDSVKSGLETELLDVSDIRSSIAAYQAIFGTSAIDGAVDIQAIAQTVNQAVIGTNVVNANTLSAISASLRLASVVPEVGPALGFLGSVFALDSSLRNRPDPSLPDIHAVAATLAPQLAESYKLASERMSALGDDLVTDPVKLHQAATEMTNGIYELTTPRTTSLVNASTYGIRQWLWGELISTGYVAWTGSSKLARNTTCLTSHPFANVADSGWWGWPDHLGGDQWWIGQHRPTYSNVTIPASGAQDYLEYHNNVGLPGSITDPLFTRIDPTKDPATAVQHRRLHALLRQGLPRVGSAPDGRGRLLLVSAHDASAACRSPALMNAGEDATRRPRRRIGGHARRAAAIATPTQSEIA